MALKENLFVLYVDVSQRKVEKEEMIGHTQTQVET